jgi:hypothetical protein
MGQVFFPTCFSVEDLVDKHLRIHGYPVEFNVKLFFHRFSPFKIRWTMRSTLSPV